VEPELPLEDPGDRRQRGRAGPGVAEVDLDSLSAELLTVVEQPMQPTAASLWLRQSETSWPSRNRSM
jgi:hypothetical protein